MVGGGGRGGACSCGGGSGGFRTCCLLYGLVGGVFVVCFCCGFVVGCFVDTMFCLVLLSWVSVVFVGLSYRKIEGGGFCSPARLQGCLRGARV